MAWTVEYLPTKDVVAIIAAGEISSEDAEAQLAETIRLLHQNHATHVLVDYSEALSEVSLPSLYGLPDYSTMSGAPWNARVAVVIPRTRYRIETYQFFELVCRNAGYDVRSFDNAEAAEDWLQQAQSVQSGGGTTSENKSFGPMSAARD